MTRPKFFAIRAVELWSIVMARSLKIVDHTAQATRAKQIKTALYDSCRQGMDTLNNDLAGYALVVWSTVGDIHTSYLTSDGLVSQALVPTLVHDALNRHVAVVLAGEPELVRER